MSERTERKISRRMLLSNSATATGTIAAGMLLPVAAAAPASVAFADDPVLTLLVERERLMQASLAADSKMIEGLHTPDRDALRAEFEAAEDQWHEFEHVIAATRATTLTGIIGKLAIAAELFECSDPANDLAGFEHCLVAALGDLRALAAKSSSAA